MVAEEEHADVPRSAASLHLEAMLVPSNPGPLRRAGAALGSIAYALAGSLETVGSTHDLVITRRDTGATIHRTTAGQREEADVMLKKVQNDLGRLTLEEFIREWSLTPES
ncbi:hypothetical protein [Microcella alkaliphila]|uniref:Uncharacterized protein n=1 Tax=Microcella alkaliphila TaxID=279828 RepID=A0A0U5BB90_9MICO|nr:hypothetical protein [Microcella alkaliphila]BAU33012.1 predicted protein [Microcella alkaliphila]